VITTSPLVKTCTLKEFWELPELELTRRFPRLPYLPG